VLENKLFAPAPVEVIDFLLTLHAKGQQRKSIIVYY
jgi:hypothetical protein